MEFSIQILPPPSLEKKSTIFCMSLGKTSKKKRRILGALPLTPRPPPPLDGKKNIFFSTFFFYVFIMFIITKFGENFEEKIDICFF